MTFESARSSQGQAVRHRVGANHDRRATKPSRDQENW